MSLCLLAFHAITCGHIGRPFPNRKDANPHKAEFATGIDRKYLSVIPGSVQCKMTLFTTRLNQRKAVITAAITQQRWLELTLDAILQVNH